MSACINDPEPEPVKKLDIGSKTELGSLEVGPEGGVLEITTGKFAGLKVTIPPNAYATKHTVRIYASSITGNSFGENVNPQSDLITFDANGVFANANITISVPVSVPNGIFAMGFYYDRENREFEGLPLANVSGSQITVVLRKPGDFFISSIETAKLGGEHTSGFVPGKDDWDFVNEGTARTPNGQLAGMSLTALWYYYTQTAKGQPPLWGRFNSEYDDPPKMWYDNVEGIQFATQTEIDFDWQKNWPDITADVTHVSDRTRNAVAYAILLTGRPQLVAISNKDGKCFPFVAYRKSALDIYLSDPSFQFRNDRKMLVADSKKGSYVSGFSSIAVDRSYYVYLTDCVYLGSSALIDFEEIKQIEASSNSAFPANVTFNTFGSELMQKDNRLYTFADSLQIMTSDSTACIVIDGKLTLIGNGHTIQLKDGANTIGILLTSTGFYGGTNLWRAFQWFTLNRAENLLLVAVKDTGYVMDELVYVAKTLLPRGTDYSIRWDLGDGRDPVITNADTLRIAYSKIGEYTLTATLYDNSKLKDVAEVTAKVSIRSFPFSILPLNADVPAGYSVFFSTQKAHNTDLHLRYEWGLSNGDKVIAYDTNQMSYKFSQSGQYLVTLKVYEATSNSLYGVSLVEIPVMVHELESISLEVLQSMNYVNISFYGMNQYRTSSRLGGEGQVPDSSNISITGGAKDTSASTKIIWNGRTFTSGYSVTQDENDTIPGGWPSSWSHHYGTSIAGTISDDGSSIQIAAGTWNKESSSNGGPNASSRGNEKRQDLHFVNLPIITAKKDLIIFYLKGPSAMFGVQKIVNSSNEWSYNPQYFFDRKWYLSTDWNNSFKQATAIVTFYK